MIHRAWNLTIDLGHMATPLNTDSNVQVADFVAANEEDGLKSLEPQNIRLHQLQRRTWEIW